MKILTIAALALLAGAPASAFAQVAVTSNATTLGTETTPGNSAGDPSASTPQGQLTPNGASSVEPVGQPAFSLNPLQAAPPQSADSTTTGVTNR